MAWNCPDLAQTRFASELAPTDLRRIYGPHPAFPFSRGRRWPAGPDEGWPAATKQDSAHRTTHTTSRSAQRPALTSLSITSPLVITSPNS